MPYTFWYLVQVSWARSNFKLSHDNLHFTPNPMRCQPCVYVSPNSRNSITKLKFVMLYSIVDKLWRLLRLDFVVLKTNTLNFEMCEPLIPNAMVFGDT